MQQRLSLAVLACLALAVSTFASGANAAPPKKPAKKAAAQPVAKPAPAPVDTAPKTPGGFMVPKEVALKSPTPADLKANAIWSIRAGLNVAALQCQFSGYLQTVNNYNAFLKHHADELSQAQTALLAHFKRVDGAKSASSFDQYNTKMYNSFSTLDAQYQFCDAAGRVGRQALATPKGQLGPLALQLYPELRSALSQRPLSPALGSTTIEPLLLAPIAMPTN